jgi:uncharacterized membrane protein
MTTLSRRTTVIILSVSLLISLCFNLFAGGAWVAGRWLDRRIEASVGRAMQPYPPALRREILSTLRTDRGALLASARDFRDARQRMFALMRADPLDREALTRAMSDVRAKTDAVQALLQSAVATSLEAVPVSERQKIEAPGPGLGLFDDANP